MTREYLKKVYEENLAYCAKKFKRQGKISKHTLQQMKKLEVKPRFDSTFVNVVDSDTFDYVRELIKFKDTTSDKVMALVMASNTYAGGGVTRGASAQEESCYRQSTLCIERPAGPEVLDDSEAILVENVIITRSNEDNYKLLSDDEQVAVNCLFSAAAKRPQLNDSGTSYKNKGVKTLMEYKIELMFKTAYQKGYDTLILSAYGSGAYGNPVGEIANIFNETMKRYNKCFKNIIYAVYEDGRGNFEVFDDMILRDLSK